jgi:hypothetical protein
VLFLTMTLAPSHQAGDNNHRLLRIHETIFMSSHSKRRLRKEGPLCLVRIRIHSSSGTTHTATYARLDCLTDLKQNNPLCATRTDHKGLFLHFSRLG